MARSTNYYDDLKESFQKNPLAVNLKDNSVSQQRSLGKIAMKKLPNENELLELLEMAKTLEEDMKEQCDLAKKIYDKYAQRISEIKKAKGKKQEV